MNTTAGNRRPGLLAIFLTLAHTGTTTFGGMWAATQQLEKNLVVRRRWLSPEQLRTSIVMATLIPAPRFLAFGGLVGFRMGGWLGSFWGITGLVLPASLLVLAGVRLISPELLGGPLAPLTRTIGIAVVGLLFGNAYHQVRGKGDDRRRRTVGRVLSAAVFAVIVAGLPLIVAAFGGFVLGALLLRESAGGADNDAETP
ncbi:MAG: chromate transporter [Nitriliruptorales bacterium]|nr:chromate transporter [Nitriliruptorales bacterium]